jgi:hypothetical protein
MSVSIKESKELLAGIELLAISGIEIAKDGLDVSDIAKALELIKKIDVILEAVKGIDGLDEEIKDLDQAELIELGTIGFSLVKKIISASKEQK